MAGSRNSRSEGDHMAGKNIFELFNNTGKEVHKIITLPMEMIQPSRYQPRLKFDEEALQELADSIKENGLIQPITVRQIDDHYEIIAGERRYRAARLAGYEEIKCYVLSPSEDQAAQMALVENVQRENLSAIEEAKSYLQIMRQASLTQEQVARKIGKSQSAVANKIRLLNLPQEIQDGVVEGKITERHARALLSAPENQQKKAYHHILKKELNVRETEAYIETLNLPEKTHKRQKTQGFSRNTQVAVNTINQSVKMIDKLGIQVKVETQETEQEVRMVIHLPKEN
jgi:ParB family chromosome partitioning protein